MPRFVPIGYGDRSGYDRTPAAARDAADERLVAAGATIGMAGAPLQFRNPGGRGIGTGRGPFMRSDLPVAGFAVIEARSLEEAVEMAAGSPCAVAHGVVEVWPLNEPGA